MLNKNKFDSSGKAFEMGQNAEKSFSSLAEARGFQITKSSFNDEMNHIDFYLKSPEGIEVSVDVKSRKKINRADSSVNDDLTWIEFKNVQGRNGWLYGKADFICFEREQDFVMVNRQSLAKLCEKLVDTSLINVHNSMPLYTGYQRKNRKDLLSLIKITDIIDNIKHIIFTK